MNHAPTIQIIDHPPSRPLHVVDWGFLPYQEAHQRQRAALADRLAGRIGDTIFLVEHPNVYTYGRGSNLDERQVPGDVELVPVERGGGVTYHGPGQLVAYPIVDVRALTGDLHRFLRWMECIIIATIAPWGLTGERHPTHTGVWAGGRKIASIGVAVRQWVSYHGLALNVATDLRYFGAIHPCGLAPEVMTSMEQLTGRKIILADVKSEFVRSVSKEP